MISKLGSLKKKEKESYVSKTMSVVKEKSNPQIPMNY